MVNIDMLKEGRDMPVGRQRLDRLLVIVKYYRGPRAKRGVYTSKQASLV